MNELYYLGFNDRSIDLYVESIEEYDEQKLHTGAYKPNALSVKKSQGHFENHIVRLQDPFNFLVSEHVRQQLSQHELTGWQTYEIEINDLKNKYFGFQVTGRSGEIIRPKEKGFYTGINIDLKTWDGSDFFVPKDTMMVICTARTKTVLENMGIGNVNLTNIKEKQSYNA